MVTVEFDQNGIIFLFAAVALRALRDQATPAVGVKCRVDAVAFLDANFPGWQKMWDATERAKPFRFVQGASHETDS